MSDDMDKAIQMEEERKQKQREVAHKECNLSYLININLNKR